MHAHRLLSTLATIGLIAVPGLARAQATTVQDLEPGSRLRLTVQDSVRQAPLEPRQTTLLATLVRITPDSLVVRPVGTTASLSYARAGTTLRGIEASRGTSRKRSILLQLVTNAVGFGAFGYLVADRGEENRVAGIGAAIGAGVGIGMGAASPYELWRQVRR